MNITPRYERRSVQVKLTAMIDVVFLLIIFFMTVSQIDKDMKEQLPLPVAEHGHDVLDREGRFIINMEKDGSIIIAKSKRSYGDLQTILRQQVATRGADEIICVLRIHQFAAFSSVQEVLGTLAKSGVWQIRFSVVEEQV